MDICKVIGNIVSSNKVDSLTGCKLLLVQPLKLPEMQPVGLPVIAMDTVGAGGDEIILLVKGSSARLTPSSDGKPVDAAIIGIIDSLEFDNAQIYVKYPASGNAET